MDNKGVKRQTNSFQTLLRSKRFRRVFYILILLIIPLLFYFFTQKKSICSGKIYQNFNIEEYLNHHDFLVDTNVGNITLSFDGINNCIIFDIFDKNDLKVIIFDNNIQIGDNSSAKIRLGLPDLYTKGSIILSDNLILVTDSEVGVVDGTIVGSFNIDNMFNAFIDTKMKEAILEDAVQVNRIIPIRHKLEN